MSTKEAAISGLQVAKAGSALAPRVDPIVSKSLEDGGTPGVQVEHTAEEAESNGAFEEMALSEAEAWESNADLTIDPNSTAMVVNGKAVRMGRNAR